MGVVSCCTRFLQGAVRARVDRFTVGIVARAGPTDGERQSARSICGTPEWGQAGLRGSHGAIRINPDQATTQPSTTDTPLEGSGEMAVPSDGPLMTAPVNALNFDPWHGQCSWLPAAPT